MLDKLGPIISIGLPAAALYHVVTTSIFLNTAADDAKGLERVANQLLVPSQYLLAGHRATPHGDTYHIRQRFDYSKKLWPKTAAAVLAVPFTTSAGLTTKSLAFLSKETRERHAKMLKARDKASIKSNNDYYRSLGIKLGNLDEAKWIEKPKHKRHADSNGYMEKGCAAFAEVSKLLRKHDIPYWLDCGTALGAQRYGGVIPWDNDIDIAILEPDHFNALLALKELDPKKYVVQDWSSRDKPYTYLKVYAREENILIDIYHHRINPEKKTATCIISNYDSIFLSDLWRAREETTSPEENLTAIFPLKKVVFDGIESFVPNDIIGYLQHRYGDNIEPAKVYNEKVGKYEKDLSHPYWQFEFAH